MSFVPAKCSACSEEIQLDDRCSTGFCSYCGSKVDVEEAVKNMVLVRRVSVNGISTIEKLLQNAKTFQKLGENDKEIQILKKITQDYPEDYRPWLRLALRYIDGYGVYGKDEDPINYFDKCYLPHTDDCIDDYFKLLENDTIKSSLILAPENEVEELKRQLSEFGKPLLSYLKAEKSALIQSQSYFQESIKVREKAISAFRDARERSSHTFFLRKKVRVSSHDLWNKCLENELECSTIDKDIYDSYWIYPKGQKYPEWQNNGNYGEFYKMYFRDCNSSYCSIDVGLKKNEDNFTAIRNVIEEYGA